MSKEQTKQSQREILKSCMNTPYCGETRFSYLDPEEKPLIYAAMKQWADQATSELQQENNELKEQMDDYFNQLDRCQKELSLCHKDKLEAQEQRDELLKAVQFLYSIRDWDKINELEEYPIIDLLEKYSGTKQD